VNRSDLRTFVRNVTNIRSTGLLSDAEINEALSDALAAVCSAYPWSFLRTTGTVSVVANDATYTLPSDARDVLLVSNRTDTRMARVLKAIDLVDAATVVDRKGTPQVYTLTEQPVTVTLFPTPEEDETLTVVYRTSNPTLAADGDVPPFDAEFHKLVAYGAALTLLVDRGAGDAKLGKVSTKYGELYERMLARYAPRTDRSRVTFRGRR
jgi:hypothetical protein